VSAGTLLDMEEMTLMLSYSVLISRSISQQNEVNMLFFAVIAMVPHLEEDMTFLPSKSPSMKDTIVALTQLKKNIIFQ